MTYKGSFIDALPNQPSITNLQLSKTEMAFSQKREFDAKIFEVTSDSN